MSGNGSPPFCRYWSNERSASAKRPSSNDAARDLERLRLLAAEFPGGLARFDGLFKPLVLQQMAAALHLIAEDDLYGWVQMQGRFNLGCGLLELLLGHINMGKVQVAIVLVGLEGDGRTKVGSGTVEVALVEVEDAAREEEQIASVRVRIELLRFGEIGLGIGPLVQLFVSETAKQVTPDKVGLLG